MKTDLERFIELYASFGIECKVSTFDEKEKVIYLNGDGVAYDGMDTQSNKFGGYYGFYSKVVFDKDGKFKKQEFYE